MKKMTIRTLCGELKTLKNDAQRNLDNLNSIQKQNHEARVDLYVRATHIIADWALQNPQPNLTVVAKTMADVLNEPLPPSMSYNWLFDSFTKRIEENNKRKEDLAALISHFGDCASLINKGVAFERVLKSKQDILEDEKINLLRLNKNLDEMGVLKHNRVYKPIQDSSDLDKFRKFNWWKDISSSEYRSAREILKHDVNGRVSKYLALKNGKEEDIKDFENVIEVLGQEIKSNSYNLDIVEKFQRKITSDSTVIRELFARILDTTNADNIFAIAKNLHKDCKDFPIDKVINIKGEYDRQISLLPSQSKLDFYTMVISELSTPIKQLDKAIRKGNGQRYTKFDLDGLKARINSGSKSVTNLDDVENVVDELSNTFKAEARRKQQQGDADHRRRQDSDNGFDSTFITTLAINDFFPSSPSSGGLTDSFKGSGGDFGGAGASGSWDHTPYYSPPPPSYDYGGSSSSSSDSGSSSGGD